MFSGQKFDGRRFSVAFLRGALYYVRADQMHSEPSVTERDHVVILEHAKSNEFVVDPCVISTEQVTDRRVTAIVQE